MTAVVKKQPAEILDDTIQFVDYLRQGQKSKKPKSLREFEILHKDYIEAATLPETENENLIEVYREAQVPKKPMFKKRVYSETTGRVLNLRSEKGSDT
jgi:hypothetical protein